MKVSAILILSAVGFAAGFTHRLRAIRKQEDAYHVRRLKYEALVCKVGPDKAYEMLKRGWDIVEGGTV